MSALAPFDPKGNKQVMQFSSEQLAIACSTNYLLHSLTQDRDYKT